MKRHFILHVAANKKEEITLPKFTHSQIAAGRQTKMYTFRLEYLHSVRNINHIFNDMLILKFMTI